jgi:ribosomal protein S19E (S16A)
MRPEYFSHDIDLVVRHTPHINPGGSVTVDEFTPYVADLDAGERFALMQLCSTAYLAQGSLDDMACKRLAAIGLCEEHDRYWRVTQKGKSVFRRMERAFGDRGL